MSEHNLDEDGTGQQNQHADYIDQREQEFDCFFTRVAGVIREIQDEADAPGFKKNRVVSRTKLHDWIDRLKGTDKCPEGAAPETTESNTQ